MDYEWDRNKAASNLTKHGVHFANAVAVFEDAQALTLDDDESDEDRFITIGLDDLGRVLVVVYTWRENRIRVISARKATPLERQEYEGEL
jgi:hypothetical protein